MPWQSVTGRGRETQAGETNHLVTVWEHRGAWPAGPGGTAKAAWQGRWPWAEDWEEWAGSGEVQRSGRGVAERGGGGCGQQVWWTSVLSGDTSHRVWPPQDCPLWTRLGPPSSHTEVLTPAYPECGRLWGRNKSVKMRPSAWGRSKTCPQGEQATDAQEEARGEARGGTAVSKLERGLGGH